MSSVPKTFAHREKQNVDLTGIGPSESAVPKLSDFGSVSAMTAVESLQEQITELNAAVLRLRERASALTSERDRIVEEVRSGRIANAKSIPQIADELEQVKRQLGLKNKQIAELAARSAQAAEQQRKDELKATITELETVRATIVDAVRRGAIELGNFYELRKKAIELLNSAHSPAGGIWPHEHATFQQVATLPDAYSGEWAHQHRDLIVGLDDCLRIRPVKKL